MLKVLLAGLGVRGRYWADVINRSDRSEIVAYADPNPKALADACQEFGDHPTYESTEDAIADRDDIEALVLANPPIGRESQIWAAAEKSFPMLIE